MRLASVLMILVTATNAVPALGQKPTVTIAVDIGGEAGDVISSLLKREIRKSSDVRIVDEAERPDVILSGVALCQGECVSTSMYVYTFQHQVLADGAIVQFSLDRVGIDATAKQSDDVARYLRGYRLIAHYSLHTAPRSSIEQSMLTYVAELDAKCFEKLRLRNARPLPIDTVAANARLEKLFNREWTC